MGAKVRESREVEDLTEHNKTLKPGIDKTYVGWIGPYEG